MGFMLETQFDSQSIILLSIGFFSFLDFVLYDIGNYCPLHLLLTKGGFEYFHMIELYYLDLLFLFI